ncbi:DNA-directed RNA polymerases II, IV and V subunit 9A, partial [Cucurbita argyrosperma subsp. argyrosperma]
MSTMKFCRECNDILYPKEDRDEKILLYACRNCDHQIQLSLALKLSDVLNVTMEKLFSSRPLPEGRKV